MLHHHEIELFYELLPWIIISFNFRDDEPEAQKGDITYPGHTTENDVARIQSQAALLWSSDLKPAHFITLLTTERMVICSLKIDLK